MKSPTEVCADTIRDLEAKLELANERIHFLVAELAAANARNGCTDYRTMPAITNAEAKA